MITLILTILLGFILSAFFSGSEMAFTSANKLRFREMADDGDSRAKKIAALQEDPQEFLTSVLIGNNIAHVVTVSAVTYGFETYFGIHNEWIVTAAVAPFLLIFGEMVPKDYCRLRSESVLLSYSGVIAWVMKLFKGPTFLMQKTVQLLFLPFGGVVDKNIFVSERELRSLIEESTRSGVLEKHEKQIIDTILDFEKIRTDSVMTPLAQAAKMEIHGSVSDARQIAAKTRSKMILVYEEDPSIVVGIVYVYDVLFEKDEKKGLREYLRSPTFLGANQSLETSFLTLQKRRQSCAVVTDALGEAIGVVPIEKLLTV